jgi:dTDP-4-amino-4,6-dideoxygalactose transaminase
MTDIQAAVGREQLQRLPGLVQERRLLAQRYDTLLQQVPRLGRPQEPPWARSNWQSYCVRLPAGVAQRQVMQTMLDAGVATRRGIMCSHREAAYASQPLPHPLPHSEAAQDGCVLLPLYAGMTTDEQAHVVASLGQACTR